MYILNEEGVQGGNLQFMVIVCYVHCQVLSFRLGMCWYYCRWSPRLGSEQL